METMMKEFLENFTKILLAVKSEHAHINTYTCVCGYEPNNVLDWNQHIADAQARKIIEYLWEK